MGKAAIDNNADIYQYLMENSSRESELKERLRAETANLPEAGFQITPEQGQLMALLARATGAKKALEIGTFTGYSALCVAEALPSDGRLVACDVSEEWTSIGRRFWEEAGVASKISLRIGPAVKSLDAMIEAGEEGSYDFVFIDADKTSYDAYYERSLRLMKQGGLMLIDNVLWGGKVLDPKCDDPDTVALRELNAKIRDDERVDASMTMIGDGLYFAVKR